MAFKFLIAFVFIAATSAGYIPTAQVYQQVGQPILTKAAEEYDPNPQYTYSYGVDDAITGDSKSQVETRDGDVVHGEYTLNDADGYKRIVKYTADPINGFNAVVQRVPLVKAVVPVAAAPVYKAAPVVYAAAPTVVRSAYVPQTVVNHVPLSYSAPVYAQYH